MSWLPIWCLFLFFHNCHKKSSQVIHALLHLRRLQTQGKVFSFTNSMHFFLCVYILHTYTQFITLTTEVLTFSSLFLHCFPMLNVSFFSDLLLLLMDYSMIEWYIAYFTYWLLFLLTCLFFIFFRNSDFLICWILTSSYGAKHYIHYHF